MKFLRALTLGCAISAFAVSASLAETPGNQLVVGFSMNNLLSLDPHAISGRETVQVLANVYDTLVNIDPVDRSRITPDLAESWEVSEDGMSITFKLRDDAVFASGNPVTAEDVKYSYGRLLTMNKSQASYFTTFGFNSGDVDESFEVVDEKTLRVNLHQKIDPFLILASIATTGPGSILDRKVVEQHVSGDDLGEPWLSLHSAGSAEYVLQDWRSNELVLLNRNDEFYGEEPDMRRIIMRHIPESQAQRLQLERGDIDIAMSLSAADLKALEENDELVIQVVPGPGFYYLAVSMKDERFQNPKVREALRYLIDYKGMNEAILPYFGKYHQRPIQEGLNGTMPDPDYGFDPEKARALLAEAGYPDGIDVELRALSEEPFLNLATALQNTLAQGGVKAEVITGTGDVVYGAMRAREFEMIVGRGGGGQIPHPDSNLRFLIYNPDNSDDSPNQFQGWRTSFHDEKLNRMIEAAVTEGDREKQGKMYENIQKRIEEVVPSIQPFSEVVTATAYRADVEGLVIHPSWSTKLADVTKNR